MPAPRECPPLLPAVAVATHEPTADVKPPPGCGVYAAGAAGILLREKTVSTTKPTPTSSITMPTMTANSATVSAKYDMIPTPAFTPKFAAVLAGECDAALYLPVRPHRTAIWDYAAAAQLLSEAGGWFGATDGTDLLEALPLEFSGGWVAARPNLRDQFLALAQRVRDGPSSRAHQ
jgi:fructose-1,6-bisphosphatase/inositol monophosphatase family enzyme